MLIYTVTVLLSLRIYHNDCYEISIILVIFSMISMIIRVFWDQNGRFDSVPKWYLGMVFHQPSVG